VLWLIVGILLATAVADELNTAYDPERFFRTQILPILEERCYDCHSKDEGGEGGLFLDSRNGWESGGELGPAILPRNLKDSPLIQAVRHLDPNSAMPPKKKLQPIEIALLETWVLLGAPDPR
jgi:Planctomycete cytochrome C